MAKKIRLIIEKTDDGYFIESPSGKIKVSLEFSHVVKFMEGYFGEDKNSFIQISNPWEET